MKKDKKDKKKLQSEFKKQIAILMTGAFSFVSALVWRDAIMEFMKPILESRESPYMMIGVALLVTFIAVIAIFGINRFSEM